MLAVLPQKIHLNFDIDSFDPALGAPATATPEPAGDWWQPTLALLSVPMSAPLPSQGPFGFRTRLHYTC